MNRFTSSCSSLDRTFLLENFLFTIGPLTALCVAYRCNLHAWLRYELIATLCIGPVLIFRPDCFLNLTMNSPIEPFHRYMAAQCGVALLFGSLFSIWLSRDSPDKGIFYGHMWSRMITALLVILDNVIVVQSESSGLHWNHKLLCTVTSFSIAILVCVVWFLSREGVVVKPRGILEDRANTYAKIDFLVMIFVGIFLYAFPEVMSRTNVARVGTWNESKASLVRLWGAFTIGTAFESFFVSEFIYLKDKRSFLLSRFYLILAEICVAVCIGFYSLQVHSIKTIGDVIVSLGLVSMALLYAYVKTPEHDHID